jgi:hypothetical protein
MVAHVALIAAALGLGASVPAGTAATASRSIVARRAKRTKEAYERQVADAPGRKHGAALFSGRCARSVNPRVGTRNRAS